MFVYWLICSFATTKCKTVRCVHYCTKLYAALYYTYYCKARSRYNSSEQIKVISHYNVLTQLSFQEPGYI